MAVRRCTEADANAVAELCARGIVISLINGPDEQGRLTEESQHALTTRYLAT